MRQFPGRASYLIGYALACVHLNVAEETMASADPLARMNLPASESLKQKVRQQLDHMEDFCNSIELNLAADQVAQFAKKLQNEKLITPSQIGSETKHLYSLISNQMKGKLFLYVPDEYSKFVTGPHPFGEEVAKEFPSASFDIAEASICLVMERSTACVFHLMRTLEVGLSALGKVFGVSLAHTNWGPAIEQIGSRIKNMAQDPKWKAQPDWKDKQQFYSQVVSFLSVAKDAWRNYTAHGHSRYTPSEATLMYMNVKAFMEKAAQQLHE